MKLHIMAMVFLMGVGQVAQAKDKPAPAVNASDKESFTTVSTWVRTEMKDGGRYAETNASEQARVDARLDEMAALFESKGAVDQMNTDEKVALLNSQEEINAILGKRDGDRLICKRERPVGSNIPVKTCYKARQIEARRQEDLQGLRNRAVTPQKRGGN